MRKKTIGQVLVLARERQGLSVSDLHKRMGLPLEFLEAVESDDLDALPGPFYVKKTLAAYAEVLDLDRSLLWQAYENGGLLAYDEVEVDSFDQPKSRQTRPKKISYLPLIYLSLIALIILIGMTYYIWNFKSLHGSSNSSSSSYELMTSTSNSSTEPSSTKTSPEVSSASQSLSKQVIGQGNHLDVLVDNIDKPIKVSLSVKQTTSWISVSDTDLAQGETLSPEKNEVTFEGQPHQTYLLTLGVKKGLTISIDGQPLDLSALTADSGTISLVFK